MSFGARVGVKIGQIWRSSRVFARAATAQNSNDNHNNSQNNNPDSSFNNIKQHNFFSNSSVPPHFTCPITQEIMSDPVMISSGHTFERIAIQEWFESGNNINPLTGEELQDKQIRPNDALKDEINSWKQQLAEELFRISYNEKTKQEELYYRPGCLFQSNNDHSIPIISFIGPNQTGKSTLLNLICNCSGVFVTIDELPDYDYNSKVVRFKLVKRADRQFYLLDVEGLFPKNYLNNNNNNQEIINIDDNVIKVFLAVYCMSNVIVWNDVDEKKIHYYMNY